MLPPATIKKLQIYQKKTYLLKFALLGTFLVCLGYVIVVVDPINCIVQNQLAIREGSLLFNLFKKPPLEVFISVYIFNITNLDAFLKKDDAKLKLEEIGPYVYQEILEHHNATFNENGTLTYTPKRTVKFIRERSIGDPNTDIVTVPNIPLLGISTAVASYSMFAALGLGTLTKSLNSQPVLNLTVHDYLWGYEDPLVRLASHLVPNIINFETFGILDRMFDEGENSVTIKLPPDSSKMLNINSTDNLDMPISEFLQSSPDYDYSETVADSNQINNITEDLERDYSIQSWNNNTGLSFWGYDEKNHKNMKNTVCNRLKGTYDGSLFPKNISKTDSYRLYRKAFCRTIPILYDHESKYYGLDAYNFRIPADAFDTDISDPNSSCMCANGKCLKKGLGNITPCYYNIPTAVSFPHFYNSDPKLLLEVDGLKPDANKHSSEIVFQPQLGVPIATHTRIQINLLMDKTKFNSRLKPFEDVTIPVVWLEIGVDELPMGLVVLLHALFNVLPYLQIGLVCLLTLSGISFFAVAILSHFCIPRENQEFNPKTDIRYSAIYWFPQIRKEIEKCTETDELKYETV